MSKISLTIIISCALVAVIGFFLQMLVEHKKMHSGLYVENTGPVAEVWLGDTSLGNTPLLHKELPAGKHSLRLVPLDDTLIPLETEIYLHSGNLTVINWNFDEELGTNWGSIYESSPSDTPTVIFNSLPDRALIYLDGALEPQFAPWEITNLSLGTHSFTLSLPSYQSLSGTFELNKNQKVSIFNKLTKETTTYTTPVEEPEIITNEDKSDTTPMILILPTNYFEDNTEVLRVRSAANVNSTTLGFAKVGSTLPYENEEKDGWYKVTYQNETGWVSGEFSEPTHESATTATSSASNRSR